MMALDLNKAHGAGLAAFAGGLLAKIIRRVLNFKWPGLVDDATFDALDDLAVAGLAWYGAYLTPHTQE